MGLWMMFFVSGAFADQRVVSLEEFGMPGVEDWIAVARYVGADDTSDAAPASIEIMEWEAHRARLRAAGRGSMDFRDWNTLAIWMRARFAELGITPVENSLT